MDNIAPPQLANDPVVRIAIGMHGDAIHTAPWQKLENGPEVAYPAEGDRPNVHVDAKNAYVRWWKAKGRTIKYEVKEGLPWKRTLRIPDFDSPQNLMIAFVGKMLSEVIRIPGGDDLIIKTAHVETLGEYRHLVLGLELVAEGDSCPI